MEKGGRSLPCALLKRVLRRRGQRERTGVDREPMGRPWRGVFLDKGIYMGEE